MRYSRPWLLALVVGCLAGPLLYALIQGYWATLTVPAMLGIGATSKYAKVFALVAMNVSGAAITSAILCAPLARFAKKNPKSLGFIVGVTTSLASLYFAYDGAEGHETTLYLLSAVEHIAFIVGCVVFAVLGSRGAR